MHRKIFRTLGAALLMALAMSVPARAETAVVAGSDVNLREGPGTNYRILDCLPWGTSVKVTDQSDDTWYAVEVDGQPGFMSAQFLNILGEQQQQELETPEPAGEGDPAWVNAMYVRFRSGPGSDYSVLGEYNRGKTLTVYSLEGAWAGCSIDGRSGYIFADYLTFGVPDGAVQAAPSPTPAPTPVPVQQEEPDDGIPAWAREQQEEPDEDGSAPTPTPTAAPTQAPAAAPAAQAAAPVASVVGEGYIAGNYVRFRTGPGTNYQIIDAYDYGQPLQIVGEADGWTACLIDGQFGYVHGAYVEVTATHEATAPMPTGSSYAEPSSTPQPTPTPAPVGPASSEAVEGYIAGNNVRMRDGASMSAGIITELFYGNRVSITACFGEWTAVIYEGQSGYVYSQFVREGSLQIEGSTVQRQQLRKGSADRTVRAAVPRLRLLLGRQGPEHRLRLLRPGVLCVQPVRLHAQPRGAGSGAQRRRGQRRRPAAGRYPLLLLRLQLHRTRRHLHRRRHVRPCAELRHRRRDHRSQRSLRTARLRGPPDRGMRKKKTICRKGSAFALPFLLAFSMGLCYTA